MKQKFVFSMNAKGDEILFKEYGEVDKDLFSLHYEAVFDVDVIKNALAKGKPEVIEAIRSVNFFPCQAYCDRLIVGIEKLLGGAENQIVEVVVSDVALINVEKEEPVEEPVEEPAGIDDLLDEEDEDDTDISVIKKSIKIVEDDGAEGE